MVKRLQPSLHKMMYQADYGDYVTYDDYQKLKASHAELTEDALNKAREVMG